MGRKRNRPTNKELVKKIKKDHEQYTLSEFLLELRKAYGFSRNFVGEKIGRSGQSILLTEHRGHIPRLDALIGFAKMYQVSPELLFQKILKDYDRRS